jgi:leader peptidase (prepilin peptidase) / N-methyltransferase
VLELILVLIFGLIIGSFLCVCIYRIPRASNFYQDDDDTINTSEESATSQTPITTTTFKKPDFFNNPKRSICQECSNQLYWWHNIPVISWLILKGKCYFCESKISARYPFVEVLSASLAVSIYLQHGITLTALIIYLVTAALLVVFFIDLDYFIIPDIISKTGTAFGITIATFNQFYNIFEYPIVANLTESVLGMLAGGGFLFIVSEVYLKIKKREGLGFGDVKLLLLIGAFFGPECALTTIFLGSLLGSIVGILMLVFSNMTSTSYIAFGPYLVVGCYIHILDGTRYITYIVSNIIQSAIG